MSGPDAVRAQVDGPQPVSVTPDRHATSWLWERAGSSDADHVLRFPTDPTGSRWEGMTVSELAARVRAVAAGLVAAGVGPGDSVVVMSPTRVDWTVADLAILSAGAVTVPLYETSSVEQCEWVVEDSGAVAALAADDSMAETVRKAGGERLREVLAFDSGALDELARRGRGHEDEVDRRLADLDGSRLATLVYTSGTTGRPKGCRITHGNVSWTVAQTRAVLGDILRPGESTLLFLPLAHIFARVVQFVCLESGMQLGYARSLETMREDLAAFRPTFLLAVPRVFQKVFTSAQRQATGAKRKVFDFAVSTADAWCAAASPSALLRLRHRVADKLVYSKLRHGVGGRVRYCVSGGAPLAPHLGRFFHAAGITILEGYGLTETTAPVTVARPDAMRFGTVGRPLPGVSVRIADDGEILVRGGNVFDGYHHNAEATGEVLVDGWLRTGDVGDLEDGFVRITDRKKEIIVTAAGKNVAPAVLEERIKSSPLVSQAMVVGDDRPFIAALITLDPEALSGRDLAGRSPADDPDLRAEVQRAIDHANEAVSRAESIRAFRIVDREFREDRGEMTPTMKLRRRDIAAHFGDEIEALYSQAKPS